ncbi:MAG: GGDEF domain-containing protein [Phenylobacterium sp.]|uniref:GGDEF domain-containing protein n=1 Tax=Phenylobacterium sp. TaxID=1871053 RepID=UPI001A3D290E|nr:GGDEF domain-containing protein [Phenylobacterium sp.]MBL8553802.1 GGDEF domain-containing protein [Phenylobacterium sp.]
MKVGGARNEPLSPLRRRSAAPGAATAAATARAADTIQVLGIPEPEMTPAVQAAIRQLLGELDDLRQEVGRLKARLTQAEDLADRDALTPLLNRRAFVRELARVRTFAERYGAAASLVYFDLDGFKAVNDRLGHAAGDTVLKAVAERLVASVRESDVVGRMGGDEFAVILVQADQAVAEAKAASLADALERDPITVAGQAARIRLSYGVREIAADADTEALVAEADAAMFAAKRLRRSA